MNLSIQDNRLIYFLQKEIAIPTAAISLVLRYYQRDPAPIPIILWQYGLVSLRQLEQILTWIENSTEQV